MLESLQIAIYKSLKEWVWAKSKRKVLELITLPNLSQIIRQEIDFQDIILGSKKRINTPHGKVNLTIPACTKNETVLKVKDHGIPNLNTGRLGDFYVILNAIFPTTITEEQKSILDLYRKTK